MENTACPTVDTGRDVTLPTESAHACAHARGLALSVPGGRGDGGWSEVVEHVDERRSEAPAHHRCKSSKTRPASHHQSSIGHKRDNQLTRPPPPPPPQASHTHTVSVNTCTQVAALFTPHPHSSHASEQRC